MVEQHRRQTICLVGGGLWLRHFCRSLAATEHMPLNLRLVARRYERLKVIAADLQSFLQNEGDDTQVSAHQDVAEAAQGSDLVILLLRVGGLRARAQDEALAQSFAQVGDEGLALGGAANAWRTFPVLKEISQQVQGAAPKAQILNLVAPLGLTTRLLAEVNPNTIGVCELPWVTLKSFLPRTKAQPSRENNLLDLAELSYLGLNHLGWFWPRNGHKNTVLKRALRSGLVDPITLRNFGAAPLHYYYEVVNTEAGQRLGRKRKPGRATQLAAISDELWSQLKEQNAPPPPLPQRSTPWFEHALIPILIALLGGPDVYTALNLPSCALTTVPNWLPQGGVLEAFTHIREAQVVSFEAQEAPKAVIQFLSSLAHYEAHLYEACLSQNESLLTEALRMGPWGLSQQEAQEACVQIARTSSQTQ